MHREKSLDPGVVLVCDVMERTTDQFFADRTALAVDIAKESAAIVEGWPMPPERADSDRHDTRVLGGH